MRLRALTFFVAFAGVFANGSDFTGNVKLASGRAAKDAVVCLQGSVKPKPLKHFVVDQRDREFIPHVSVVPVGTTVDFPNDDDVFHNVFAEYQAKRFDLGMYPRGAVKHQTFEKPGLVALMCSVHSEMGAFIQVVDTPYYAVTDRSGRFTIKNVPPGTYVLKVWHESGETCSQTINVTDSNSSMEVRTVRR